MNMIVVNGEKDWSRFFSGFEVSQVRLQESQWLFVDKQLWVVDGQGSMRVDAVFWRVGAIRPEPAHRTVLEMIRAAKVPCVNSVQVLLRCYDRLSMLNEMREAGLPVIEYTVSLGDSVIERLRPRFPVVLKVGNYHAGLGKAMAKDEAHWSELRDLSFSSIDYKTLEPFIDYTRDIRCLAIGEHIWAMSRKSATWRANANTKQYEIIDPPEELLAYTKKAMLHLSADIVGLDFLEQRDGSFVLLECNDTPGLSGFPEIVRDSLASVLRQKITLG